MEDWEIDFYWLKVQHYVQNSLDKDALPDLQAVLFLLGVQESGVVKDTYTKEEKEDLMHVAVCSLLEREGYFEFTGNDQDGWPHFRQIRGMDVEGVKNQEILLKQKVIQYFIENHFIDETKPN